MTDTRRANPSYQLDVDILKIEYILYRTVEAQQDYLKAEVKSSTSRTQNHISGDDLRSKRDAAARMVQTFDILIQLFHHNHPLHIFSEGYDFNLKVLQFLVLLEYWIKNYRSTQGQVNSDHSTSIHDVPSRQLHVRNDEESLNTELLHDRITYTALRRHWLGLRGEASESPSSTFDTHKSVSQANGRNTIRSSNSTRHDGFSRFDQSRVGKTQYNDHKETLSQSSSSRTLTLFDLTPRFMALSVDIARFIGAVNELWLHLAGELMLNSALERVLSMDSHAHEAQVINRKVSTIGQQPELRTQIEECFAWGYVDTPSDLTTLRIRRELARMGGPDYDPHIDEKLRLEDDVSEMFSTRDLHLQEGNNTRAADFSIQELARWTNIRDELTKNTDIFNWPVVSSRDKSTNQPSLGDRVLECYDDHPIETFLSNLLRYMSAIWTCNNSPDVNGKPILVQIEEGGIDGMSDQDFTEFLRNVGLKRNDTRNGHGTDTIRIQWNL